jgi:hypothetical protein
MKKNDKGLIPFDQNEGAKNLEFKAAVLDALGTMFTEGSMARSQKEVSLRLPSFTIPANQCSRLLGLSRLYVTAITLFCILCSCLIILSFRLSFELAANMILLLFLLLSAYSVFTLVYEIQKLNLGPVAKLLAKDWNRAMRNTAVAKVCKDFQQQLEIIVRTMPAAVEGDLSEEWDALARCDCRVDTPLHNLFRDCVERALLAHAQLVTVAPHGSVLHQRERSLFSQLHQFGKIMQCAVASWKEYFRNEQGNE